VFDRDDQPIGPEVRFLPGRQHGAANGASNFARMSGHGNGLRDLVTGQAGRARSVRDFHEVSMMVFPDGLIEIDQCDAKEAGAGMLWGAR
jgi:hypothetical protein